MILTVFIHTQTNENQFYVCFSLDILKLMTTLLSWGELVIAVVGPSLQRTCQSHEPSTNTWQVLWGWIKNKRRVPLKAFHFWGRKSLTVYLAGILGEGITGEQNLTPLPWPPTLPASRTAWQPGMVGITQPSPHSDLLLTPNTFTKVPQLFIGYSFRLLTFRLMFSKTSELQQGKESLSC